MMENHSSCSYKQEKEVLKLGELELDMEKFILRKNGFHAACYDLCSMAEMAEYI